MHVTIKPKPPSHFLLRRVLNLPLSDRHQAVIIAVGNMQILNPGMAAGAIVHMDVCGIREMTQRGVLSKGCLRV